MPASIRRRVRRAALLRGARTGGRHGLDFSGLRGGCQIRLRARQRRLRRCGAHRSGRGERRAGFRVEYSGYACQRWGFRSLWRQSRVAVDVTRINRRSATGPRPGDRRPPRRRWPPAAGARVAALIRRASSVDAGGGGCQRSATAWTRSPLYAGARRQDSGRRFPAPP